MYKSILLLMISHDVIVGINIIRVRVTDFQFKYEN